MTEITDATPKKPFGQAVLRFFDVPPKEMGFKFWGEHLRNFAIVFTLATVAGFMSTHSVEFDPNFPRLGKFMGYTTMYLAMLFGAANIVHPALAIFSHGRKLGGWSEWLLIVFGYALLFLETMIVVGMILKPIIEAAAR